MTNIFLSVLGLSIKASYVIVMVLLIRFLLKKSPRIFSYLLWLVVAFRLVIPFSFESQYSLVPNNVHNVQFVQKESRIGQRNSVKYVTQGQVNQKNVKAEVTEKDTYSIGPKYSLDKIGTHIWLLGMICLASYSFYSIYRLKEKLVGSRQIDFNVFQVENLRTPFVLGILKPRIYLPAGLDKKERGIILLHEKTHLDRRDHIIKILAFAILTLHWFNPLVWLSFILMSKDMEVSCDEKVLNRLNLEDKKFYASSLLSLSMEKQIINGGPLAFGEGNMKERIKGAVKYKKAPLWILLLSFMVTITMGVGLVSNPKRGHFAIKSALESVFFQEKMEVENLSDIGEFKYGAKYETNNKKILEYVQSNLKKKGKKIKEIEDINLQKYSIKNISKNKKAEEFFLYYNDLYDQVFLETENGVYESNPEFARYIEELFDYRIKNTEFDPKVQEFFAKYNWTVDYQVNEKEYKFILEDLEKLYGFEPAHYYFAHGNEFSKDIGLDLNAYQGKDLHADIFRLREAFPTGDNESFTARGIVIKYQEEIVGAFIDIGRHSSLTCVSLSRKNFEEIKGKNLDQWLGEKVMPSKGEELIAKASPEVVLEEYFKALNEGDKDKAKDSYLKRKLLSSIQSNNPKNILFNESIDLSYEKKDIAFSEEFMKKAEEGESLEQRFLDLEYIKLISCQEVGSENEQERIYEIEFESRYEGEKKIVKENIFCWMTYESPQTGWKIKDFGY